MRHRRDTVLTEQDNAFLRQRIVELERRLELNIPPILLGFVVGLCFGAPLGWWLW